MIKYEYIHVNTWILYLYDSKEFIQTVLKVSSSVSPAEAAVASPNLTFPPVTSNSL